MLLNPCKVATSANNTGTDCNDALKATAMLIMVPKKATWTDTDIADFMAYIETQVHASGKNRWLPIFGQNAPIRDITANKENDVLETFADGATSLIRYGMYSRTFMTNEGGICLGKALRSFGGSAYSFIEIDIEGNVAFMDNGDGTYSGFPVNLAYAPLPDLADFKTSYKNAFLLNFSPKYYIDKGVVFNSDQDLSSIMGLLDVAVTLAAPATTTKLKIGVQTVCSETDLVDQYDTSLAVVNNFIVTKAGAPVTPSAAAIVDGHVELTIATATTGDIYKVSLAEPAVLKTAGIVGYEGLNTLSITIP